MRWAGMNLPVGQAAVCVMSVDCKRRGRDRLPDCVKPDTVRALGNKFFAVRALNFFVPQMPTKETTPWMP